MPDTQSASEVRVAANGDIHYAYAGASPPVTPTETLGAAFRTLGLADEDGVTFSDEKTVEDIKAWQRFYPVRKIVTERMASVQVNLLQWNGDTVQAAFGGGTVTEPVPNVFKYTPPSPEDLEEVVVVVDWRDGDYHYRLVMPRALSTETVETNLTRTDAAKLPVTFSVLGDDEGDEDPWYILTDDPAFDPAAIGS